MISGALTDYPGFASLLQNSIKSFHETGPALVFGVLLTVLGTRGVANAIQNGLNSVWEVPRSERPGFPWSWLRSFVLILVVGVGEISVSVGSGFISTATFLPGFALKAASTAVTLTFSIGLFWLAFRVATAKLWPRSLAAPPQTPEDVRAYELYAQAQDRKGETVSVNVTSLPDAGHGNEKMPGGAGADGAPVSARTARGEDRHDSGDDDR